MTSTSPSVLESLRADIIAGSLAAGERLKEDVIAKKYGVSRVPVREALRQLESEGFIVSEKYRGATVSLASEQSVVELMQIRRGLEVLAANLAAAARGGDAAEGLRSVVARGQQASTAHEVGKLAPLIMEFHELVAKASGNAQLEQMLDRVLQRIAWGFELDIEERIDSSWSDHAAIASAILNGAPSQAGYLMDEHILKDENLYKAKSSHGDDVPAKP